mgnify:CR=1 FL=1
MPVAHTFNHSTWKQRQEDLCEFKAYLVYSVSSRTVRDTQRDSVSKTNQMNKQTKIRQILNYNDKVNNI